MYSSLINRAITPKARYDSSIKKATLALLFFNSYYIICIPFI